MSINVLTDSSCEMPDNLKASNPVISVPFKLYIDNEELIDDANLNVIEFIDRMTKSSTLPRSACPSPNDFQSCFNSGKDNYIVTISARLSGTYNSAMLAKAMDQEENPDRFIHVFDSKSASIGETLIALKIHELDGLKVKQMELIEQVNNYISEMHTFFVSESLDNLMKNGRISKLKGTIATALKIKPIMGADANGEIQLMDKARGSAKAFQRLVEIIEENAKNVESKILAISHVNNPDRANWIKEEVKKCCNFKDIIVVQTGGLSSLYCDNQGIIVAF